MPQPAHRRALQIAVALCFCADPTLTATARAFRGIASFKKLGVRSGALVAPGKGRKSTTVLTIATPPGRGGPLAEQGRVDECEALESRPPHPSTLPSTLEGLPPPRDPEADVEGLRSSLNLPRDHP